MRLVFVSFKLREKRKASATAADELNLDVLEEGRQQQRAKYVFRAAVQLLWIIVYEAAPLRSTLQ